MSEIDDFYPDSHKGSQPQTRRHALRRLLDIGLGAGALFVAGELATSRQAKADVQAGWRWCEKCKGLFFADNPTNGSCSAGGQHAEGVSFLYLLQHQPTVNDGFTQNNWRLCTKCQGLFYAGNGTAGACPAGDGHDQGNSFDYVLDTLRLTNPNLQYDWRWCHKCQGLFFGGHASISQCPAGGRHEVGVSFDYYLAHA